MLLCNFDFLQGGETQLLLLNSFAQHPAPKRGANLYLGQVSACGVCSSLESAHGG